MSKNVFANIDRSYNFFFLKKALLNHFFAKNIFDNAGKVKPEFTEEYNKALEELLEIVIHEPQLVIEKYGIKEFSGSMSWVGGFMKRHDLVFRRVHYERRGAIQKDWTDSYLTQVTKACTYYGIDHVLNMDETHVSIDNFSPKVISNRGQETIPIYTNHCNKTDGFTIMATCGKNKKFPLVIIVKGKTGRSTYKFNIRENAESEFLTSVNG